MNSERRPLYPFEFVAFNAVGMNRGTLRVLVHAFVVAVGGQAIWLPLLLYSCTWPLLAADLQNWVAVPMLSVDFRKSSDFLYAVNSSVLRKANYEIGARVMGHRDAERPCGMSGVDGGGGADHGGKPGTPPAGFVVLHRGGDGAAYLNAYTWVWDNVLHMRGAAAAQPALGCPDADPAHFITLDRPWIGCVWELPPIQHERDAWVRHMLVPDAPDLAGYLRDRMAGGTTGRLG
jgi:hypothetical protein